MNSHAVGDAIACSKSLSGRRLPFGRDAMGEIVTIAEIEARCRTDRPLASPEWAADAARAINGT